MKKLLILGAALLGLGAFNHTARAGDDYPDDHSYRRHDYYEGRPVYREREYCEPPRVIVETLPPPVVVYRYPRPYYYHPYHRRPHVSFFLGF